MHVRFSMVKGTTVVDDTLQAIVGKLDGIVINPDNGHIEGFFVAVTGLFSAATLFLNHLDILSWGTVIHIRDSGLLAPPEELIRLQPLFADRRTVIGQKIITEQAHTYMGVCKDVQFNTRQFMMEWLFPRKYLFTKTPIPASDIKEITRSHIIVREPLLLKEQKSTVTPAEAMTALQEVIPSTN